ncbi:MAG: helix-turn-helix transcriptional regulator [Bryobacteraceae bacterium]
MRGRNARETLRLLGRGLKSLREARKIKQGEILENARGLYADESSLRRIERGQRRPTRERLLKLVLAYGEADPADIDVLLEAAGYAPLSATERRAFAAYWLAPELTDLSLSMNFSHTDPPCSFRFRAEVIGYLHLDHLLPYHPEPVSQHLPVSRYQVYWQREDGPAVAMTDRPRTLPPSPDSRQWCKEAVVTLPVPRGGKETHHVSFVVVDLPGQEIERRVLTATLEPLPKRGIHYTCWFR